MNQIFTPAIKLADEGVPIPYKTAVLWNEFKCRIETSKQAMDILNKKKSYLPGEKLYAHKLAHSFKLISSHGAECFYGGEIAENIIKEVHIAGGVLTLEDLKEHLTYGIAKEPEDPLFVDFCGFRIWEMKPNTIGIVTLVALNVLQFYDLKTLGHNSAEYIHIVSEVTKYAFLECWDYLCDPEYNSSFKVLLSEDVAKRLKSQIDNDKICSNPLLITGGNTSYVAVVDQEGNGCSFICSVFSEFGVSLIPENCGFVLHDRLKCMDLNESSANAYGPKKLPLHTIIPSMITNVKRNELLAVLGVCGRWMQPQGKIQLLLDMIIFGMDPQTALNQPRFFVGDWKTQNHFNESLNMLTLEAGIPLSVVPPLLKKGHDVTHSVDSSKRILFGKGNIIAQPIVWNRNVTDTQMSWWAAADPRTDGSAMGF